MKEKNEQNSRLKGLFRLMIDTKKLISITSVFGVIFSIIGFLIPDLAIGKGFLIVFASFFTSSIIAIAYLFIRALVIEKKAKKIMKQYLDELEKTYEEKRKEFNLIDRIIKSGLPLKITSDQERKELSTWNFQLEKAVDWLKIGIENKAHIFIEGQMGIGKTMLSLALAHKLSIIAKEKLDQKDYADIRIPILVPLGRTELFARKYLESDFQIGGEYRNWIKDIICKDLEVDEKTEVEVEKYLKNMCKDLSIFTLIFDGFDEFKYKKYYGRLSPLTLFKHEDMRNTWKGPVVITSRPFVLDRLENDLLREAVEEQTNFGFRLYKYKLPFAYALLPLFRDEDTWKYISQNRPILKSINRKQFEEEITEIWQKNFGDDWRIPLYLWSLSSYDNLKAVPKNKKELFYSIFDLHFGWYYSKKDAHIDKTRKRIEEQKYREYVEITEERNIILSYSDFWIKPAKFHEWQKGIFAEFALYLSENGKVSLSEKEFNEIVSRYSPRLHLSKEEEESFPDCLKQTIEEGTYIFCSSYQELNYSFSPWRMQEMLTAIKLTTLSIKECIESLRKIFSSYDKNKEIIKIFWEFVEEEDQEKAEEIFNSTLPSFDALKSIAEQCKIKVVNLFDKIEINSNLELISLHIDNLQIEEINMEPISKCAKLENLTINRTELISIDLEPLSKCIQLQTLQIEGNKLTSIDLEPLSKCKKLHKLHFWNNKLTSIDLEPLIKCPEFRGIRLYKNKLSSINLEALSKCSKLEILDLASNNLTEINLEPLRKCKKLMWLYLNYNHLYDINLEPLSECSELQKLKIGGNQFIAINLEPLSKCINFQEIDLSGNQLIEIDLRPLSKCRKLQRISIVQNHLSEIELEPLSKCSNFQEIDLSRNRLSTINLEPLNKCADFRQIHAGGNRIEEIILEPLGKCSNLKGVYLGNNLIANINLEPLGKCSQLRYLYLSKNQLTSIDLSPLSKNHQLQMLEVDENKIDVIDVSPLVSHSFFGSLRYDRRTTRLICAKKQINKIQAPALRRILKRIELK